MFRIVVAALVLSVTFTTLLPGTARAQGDVWAPPEPAAEEKDWVQISSGEWLRGSIDLMRDETLYFDSEEFDDVTVDWVDITLIRSARPMTYVMVDGSMVTGTSVFKDNLLMIDTPEGVREIPRNQISAILEGKPTELNFWSAKIGADLRLLSGNTEQDDFNSRLFLKREAARSRIDLHYQGNYSKTNDVQTVKNNRGNAEWKLFLSRKFFLSPVKVEYYYDKFQNLEGRLTAGVGLGYYLIRSSKTDWFVELGYSYRDTRFISVEEGADDRESNGSIPLRTTLETDITKRIELTAEYGVQMATKSGVNSSHHGYLLLEIEIWKDFDFDASVTWDHNTHPQTNADGITPFKDDLAMYYGISLNF